MVYGARKFVACDLFFKVTSWILGRMYFRLTAIRQYLNPYHAVSGVRTLPRQDCMVLDVLVAI